MTAYNTNEIQDSQQLEHSCRGGLLTVMCVIRVLAGRRQRGLELVQHSSSSVDFID